MVQVKNVRSLDAPLRFKGEGGGLPNRETGRNRQMPSLAPWKVLVVDDEAEVHVVTRLVFDGFSFDSRGVEILSGYSGREGRELVKENPDAAVLILDVVMESDQEGLDMVKEIREEYGNQRLRIIIRTGQPGQAQEHKVMSDYDINDFREKATLTDEKLIASVTNGLRAYRDLKPS